MRRSFRPWTLMTPAAALALAGCASTPPGGADQPKPAVVVDMYFHSFNPKSVTIHAGEAVQWHNKTPVVFHTVTNDPAKAENAADAELPAGATPIDSGNVTSGSTFQHVFTVPGTYRYFCKPHESNGMTGEVIVEPAAK